MISSQESSIENKANNRTEKLLDFVRNVCDDPDQQKKITEKINALIALNKQYNEINALLIALNKQYNEKSDISSTEESKKSSLENSDASSSEEDSEEDSQKDSEEDSQKDSQKDSEEDSEEDSQKDFEESSIENKANNRTEKLLDFVRNVCDDPIQQKKITEKINALIALNKQYNENNAPIALNKQYNEESEESSLENSDASSSQEDSEEDSEEDHVTQTGPQATDKNFLNKFNLFTPAKKGNEELPNLDNLNNNSNKF